MIIQPTERSVRQALRDIGVTLGRRNSAGEWRVNLKGGRETTAYYASDIQDALDTGLAMARNASMDSVDRAEDALGVE